MRLNTPSTLFLNISFVTLALATSLAVSGCAHRMAHPDADAEDNKFTPVQPVVAGQPTPVELPTGPTAGPAIIPPGQSGAPQQDPRMSSAGLNARVDELEAKIARLNEKLDSTRASVDGFLTAHQPKVAGVSNSPSEAAGTPLADVSEGGAGFIQNGAVQLYRKANILFESQKYPEANLAYMNFLEKYPDHPLAGSAQFHVGDGYFKQKEYKQAVEEFQKVLTSYDRSPVVSITLRKLTEAEDALGKAEEAARYRQQLLSLFPNSPSAQNLPQVAEVKPAAPTTAQSETLRDQEAPRAAPAGKRDLDQPPPTAPLSEKQGPGETTPQ
jgi:tol-pal system protein YbgF